MTAPPPMGRSLRLLWTLAQVLALALVAGSSLLGVAAPASAQFRLTEPGELELETDDELEEDMDDEDDEDDEGDEGDEDPGLAPDDPLRELVPLRGSPVVKAIEIAGLRNVDRAGVRSRVYTQLGKRLDRARLTEDVKRVYRTGFFDKVDVREAPHPEGGVVLTFVVDERPTIAGIQYQLEGDAVDQEDIEKVVDLKRFAILDEAAIKRNLAKIKDLYVEEGHFLAETRYELVPAPNGSVVVRLIVDEGDKVQVKTIHIVGNSALDADEIKGVLATREGGWLSFLTKAGQFKREFFEQDLQRIQLLYLTKGHVQIRVDDPVVTLSPDKRSMTITIRVDEGPAYDVATIDVTMADDEWLVPKEDIVDRIRLEEGERFDYQVMQEDIQRIGDVYRDLGYANATVATQNKPDPEAKTIAFTYTVQKGELVRIGRIEFRGNKATRDKVIRRELKIAEGELYSQTAIRRSQARVQALGFFDAVEITPKPTDRRDTLDLVVTVKENNTGTFQVGAGFSSLESFLLTAQIRKDNFLGRGQTVSAQAILSALRQQFQLSFFEPYFFDTDVTFAIDLYNFQDDLGSFNRRKTGGSLSFGYRFTDWFALSLTYTAEDVDTSFQSTKSIQPAPFDQRGVTSAPRLTLSFDTRNNRLFPSDGQFTTLSLEHASRYTGSENDFTRLLARSRWYFGLPLQMIFKMNASFGWIFTSEPTTPIPIFESFFLGGIGVDNLRGYNRNSIGPECYTAQEPDATPGRYFCGGNKKVLFNAELEFPIFDEVGIRGVLFFDIGNIYAVDEDIDLGNLRSSVGFGFRWQSPVGPLRFEWGIPLTPRDGDDPIVFEFTIGNSF